MSDALDLVIARGPPNVNFSPLSDLFGKYAEGRETKFKLEELARAQRQAQQGEDFSNTPDPFLKNLGIGQPGGGYPAPGGASPYGNRIGGIESGGNYAAVGPDAGKGDRAYGKYQVMGANVGPWTQEVLGRPMTPQEFLANPQAQDAVFNAKFGNYVQKYGPQGAARAWFAGEGGMNNPNAKDVLGTSVSAYQNKFDAAGGAPAPAAPSRVYSQSEFNPIDATAPGAPAGDFSATDLSSAGRGGAPAPQPQAAPQPAGANNLIFGRFTVDQAQTIADQLTAKAAQMAANPALRPSAQIYANYAQQFRAELDKRTALPSFAAIGTDQNGNPLHGFVNPATQTVTPAQIPGAPGMAGATPNVPTVTGEEFLKTMEPGRANIIRQLVEGRLNPPQLGRAGSPQVMALLRDAAQYDPSYDATNWQGRSTAVKSFMGGKDADTVRALNQAILHAGSLQQSADALGNTQYPPINAAKNIVGSALLGQDAKNNFVLNAHAFAEEMSKAFKGANLSDAEVRQWEANLGPNMSPEQQRGAIGKGLELLHGALQALEEKRLQGVGPAMATRMGPLLKDDPQKVLQRVDQWVGQRPGVTPSTGPGSAEAGKLQPGMIVIQNGVKFQIQPDGSGKALQ